MTDKTLIAVEHYDPPAVPTTDHAERFLDWHLWKSAEWLALEDASMADKHARLTEGNWSRAVVRYFSDPERREELYSLTLQRLEAMSTLTDGAVLQLLHRVRQEQIYTLEGWRGVSGWALSRRAGYSPTGGTWYRLGQLVDHVIPWISAHLTDRDPKAFFDMAYVHRLAVVMPRLVDMIEWDGDRGTERAKREVADLLNDARTRTKEQLSASYTRSRHEPIPAWLVRTDDDRLRLILAIDQDRVQIILNRLGAYIDYRGEQEGDLIDA